MVMPPGFHEAARGQRALGCRHGKTKRDQIIGPKENYQGAMTTALKVSFKRSRCLSSGQARDRPKSRRIRAVVDATRGFL